MENIFNNLVLDIKSIDNTVTPSYSISEYNDNITQLIFTYNNETPNSNITEYTIKLNSNDENTKFFKCSALIVAGGGGGGYNIGGGGGGGGVIYIDNFILETNNEYNLYVGKGGNGCTNSYYHGESGYNSGINSIVAVGGGGGSSYQYGDLNNFFFNDKLEDTYTLNELISANDNGKGLSGGSGGGSCGIQSNIEYYENAVGKSNKIENLFSSYENYHIFGNDGKNGIFSSSDNIKNNIKITGGGGGGAGSQTTLYQDGGIGINVENIVNGSIYNYCSILKEQNECSEQIIDNFENTVYKAMRSSDNTNTEKYYWGGGGGAGSLNNKAGDGGKGGGGGGGYYELKNNFIQDNFKGNITDNITGLAEIIRNKNLNILTENNNGETSLNIAEKLANGGNGIQHTGGGGGGGGLLSNGGNGGSGIIILLLQNNGYIPEKEESVSEELNEKLLNNMKNNKKILGKNLSYLYNYNVKDNKELYHYIDKLYETDLLDKNTIFKYSYDRKLYDIKLHQYIKIIFDLKVDYDSFLFYSKARGEDNKYIDNYKLYDYQKIIILMIDIIEDLLIYTRDNKNNFDILNDIDILKIEFLKDAEDNIIKRNNYDFTKNNKEIIKEIENLKEKIKELRDSKTLKKNINKQDEIDKEIVKLDNLLGKNNELLEKNQEKDLYYRYSEKIVSKNKLEKTLTLFISGNNNYKVGNNKNILDKFVLYTNNSPNGEYNIKDLLNNKNMQSLIEKEFPDENNQDINSFIKIYLYSIIKVKKYNFERNIISLYILFSLVNVLQNIYKDSEKILLGDKIKDFDLTAFCNSENNVNKIYLNRIDKILNDCKLLTGYNFIDKYIGNYDINAETIIHNINYPNIKLKINEQNSENILKHYNITKYSDDENNNEYYKILKESFLIEIDNVRYNITDFKIEENNIIIEIDDRDSNIKKKEKDIINNITIVPKDHTYITKTYNNDVDKIRKYNNIIKNYKTDLEIINNKYDNYKLKENKFNSNKNTYYLLLIIITLTVFYIYLFNKNPYNTRISLFVILFIITLTIIYNNYYTFTYIENFEDKDIHHYYEINIVPDNIIDTDNNIKIILDDNDIDKLKIRKIDNVNEEYDIINLLISKLHIIYNKNIVSITNFEITTDDYYYYINAIIIEQNSITTEMLNASDILKITIVKKDNNIITKLLSEHDNYMKNVLKGDRCIKLLNYTEALKLNSNDEDKVKINRLEKTYNFRNNMLDYINTKFLFINKFIETIEIEKSNKISNNIYNALKYEKNNYKNYIQQYEYKKNYNTNVNNLYGHKLLENVENVNILLNIYFIIIITLLLLNLFPGKYIYVMILAIILLTITIIMYTYNINYPTRKKSYNFYWQK